MKKPIQRIEDMNFKRLYGLSFLAVFLLTGCNSKYTLWGSSEDPEIMTEQEVTYVQNAPVTPVVVPPEEPTDPTSGYQGAFDDDQFVDYRRTAANYREFGERTPQDQYILSGGPGSNMSAAIPPTIEEEVANYEEAVNEAFEDAVADSGDGEAQSSGDDAVEDWLAEEGNTLKGLLSDWCERAGWRLVWKSNRNYTLNAGAMFRGRFADVSSALIRTFARAQPAPLATFYKGNRVLVVETREDENAFN